MLKEIAKLPQFTPLIEVWSYCNTGLNEVANRQAKVARPWLIGRADIRWAAWSAP